MLLEQMIRPARQGWLLCGCNFFIERLTADAYFCLYDFECRNFSRISCGMNCENQRSLNARFSPAKWRAPVLFFEQTLLIILCDVFRDRHIDQKILVVVNRCIC
jgi:hypothetical protein